MLAVVELIDVGTAIGVAAVFGVYCVAVVDYVVVVGCC